MASDAGGREQRRAKVRGPIRRHPKEEPIEESGMIKKKKTEIGLRLWEMAQQTKRLPYKHET